MNLEWLRKRVEHHDDQTVKRFLAQVRAGEIDAVRAVLDAAPAMVNAVGPHPIWGGRPQPLHVAIEGRRRDMFDLLLERGADVNGRNDQYDGWSPLMLAIHGQQSGMRDELLRRGARVGVAEALMMAEDARLDELLESGLPDIAPNGGSFLAFARTAHAIDRLLALGASAEMKDRWGVSPIEAMSRLGSNGAALVQQMIARGVPASPVEYARLGDLAMLQCDPSVARRDDVLMAAVDARHHEMVEWLLRNGANPNARAERQSRQTALHSAAWNGDLRMVQMLVSAGADAAARDEEHDATPLGWAETSLEITNNPECGEVAGYLRAIN